MDYEHIRKLAEKRAAAEQYAEALGRMNVPSDPERRIAQSAQYRLASDAFSKADDEYRKAMNALSADELNELVGKHNANSL
jgi:hypothetical protein